MKVPLLDLGVQHAPLRDEILAAVTRVLDSNRFILGDEVASFESEIAGYCGADHGIAVSSGTDALLVSLMALEIGPGDDVIVPDFSFFATAGVVSRVGARPTFVDIDPETYNLDPTSLERVLTPNTKAIVVVHLYGQCADMDPILELAREHNIAVIEDAAQALGAEYRGGRRAGTLGKLGCFSFFPSKNLGGPGDSGMVVTDDEELASKIRILRVHGAKPKYYNKLIGGNFRMDALQAAVLRVKLAHLDEYTSARQHNAARYQELLGALDIELPAEVYRSEGLAHHHIYNQFVIRTSKRDDLRSHLASEGIGSEVYYPVAFHQQECFSHLGCDDSEFAAAIAATKEVLAIPVYPGLTEEMLVHVAQSVADFLEI